MLYPDNILENRETWSATAHGVTVRCDLATKQR